MEFELNNIAEAGINYDKSPWKLGAEYITSGVNFRIIDGKVISSGGYTNLGFITNPINFSYIYQAGMEYTSPIFMFGSDTINIYVNGSVVDVTPSGMGSVDGSNWSTCQLSKVAVFNNEYPYYYYDGSGVVPLNFKPDVTWKEVNKSASVIRSHKTFLFALDLTEDGVNYPDKFRWSTSADVNGLPFTWDEEDESGIAGSAQLGGDGGRIIDGLSLRDSFCIYSESSIDILDFTGGEFIWNRRELSNTVGLLSKDSVVEVKGNHYFIGDGDILINTGGDVKSLLHQTLKTRVQEAINPKYKHLAFAVKNTHHKEIWFCIPTGNDTYPSTAFILNWADNSWSVRSLDEGFAHCGYCYVEHTTPTWESVKGSWEEARGSWLARQNTPRGGTLIGCINDDLKDIDSKVGLDSPFAETFIERILLPISGHRLFNTLTRAYLYMTGSPVYVMFGSHAGVGEPVRWSEPVKFDPSVDRFVDLRTTGSLHSYRISSVDETGYGVGDWEITGMLVEYQIDGER